jgi:DNA-directed RNA polymerase subunit RPC12/RpoP
MGCVVCRHCQNKIEFKPEMDRCICDYCGYVFVVKSRSDYALEYSKKRIAYLSYDPELY